MNNENFSKERLLTLGNYALARTYYRAETKEQKQLICSVAYEKYGPDIFEIALRAVKGKGVTPNF